MFSTAFSGLIVGLNVRGWNERTGHYPQYKTTSRLKPQIEVNKRTPGDLGDRLWQGRERSDNSLLMDKWHGPEGCNQVYSQISLLSGKLLRI